eukprot:m.883715 g.883715  ORF g.883715 m.883715 type:complete len:963 (+) comp23611_c0_seq3:316-3204(+)
MSSQILKSTLAWQFETRTPPSHVQCAVSPYSGSIAVPSSKDHREVSVWTHPKLSSIGRASDIGENGVPDRTENGFSTVMLARLGGHEHAPTAMAFAPGDREGSERLLTAATGELFLWTLDGLGASDDDMQHRPVHGVTATCTRLPADGIGHVQMLSVEGTLSVACSDASVVVHDVTTVAMVARLEGHGGRVTAAALTVHTPTTMVVSAAEDHTFAVWDVDAGACVFRSAIEPRVVYNTVVMDRVVNRVALGTDCGMIKFFSLDDFKDLHTLSFHDALRAHQALSSTHNHCLPSVAGPKIIQASRSFPAGGRLHQHVSPPAADSDGSDSDDIADAVADPVLQLCFPMAVPPSPDPTASGFADVLFGTRAVLLVCVRRGVGVVDANNYAVLGFVDWHTPSHNTSGGVGMASGVQLVQNHRRPAPTTAVLTALVTGAFERTVDARVLHVAADHDTSGCLRGPTSGASATAVDGALTMLSSTPLAPDSPLHAELKLVAGTPTGKGSAGRGTQRGVGATSTTNAPLTFGRKIRSSGYGPATGAPRKMFQPQTGRSSARRRTTDIAGAVDPARFTTKPKSSPVRRAGDPTKSGDVAEAYPMDAPPPTVCARTLSLADATTTSACPAGPKSLASAHAISLVGMAAHGRALAAAQTDATVTVVKLPGMFPKECRTYLGHDGAAVMANWSVDNKYLLTASRSAVRVWNTSPRAPADPVLVMDKRVHNFKPKPDEPPNKPFEKNALCGAQFYYMDKFILVGGGNTVSLYKHKLDDTVDDVRRYVSKSKYRLVTALTHPGTQGITTFAAANSYYSYLAISAGTDRSLCVLDFNVAKAVHTIPHAQARPVHRVRLNVGAPHAAAPAASFNLFFTAAVGDGVCLWDVRAGTRAVRRFCGHVDRAHAVGLDFSPCGRYVATGSEDRRAYVYDLRNSSVCVARLGGHPDVVTDIAYHPLRPELLTACADGSLRIFTP